MNTNGLTLSVRVALERSLSFATDFVKQYWVIVLLYVVAAAVGGFILQDTDPLDLSMVQRLQLVITGIFSIGLGMLMPYYGISMAISQLDPGVPVFKKSLPKALWQLFCVSLLMGFVATPLLILFIIPGIWWLIKSSVSIADLLSTEDGAIASIKSSHQLMNNRFWQCFGFLFFTGSIIGIVSLVLMGSIGLCLFIGGVFHSVSSLNANMHGVANVFRTIGSIISVFTTIIYYYLQAWLYVYLKNTKLTPQV